MPSDAAEQPHRVRAPSGRRTSLSLGRSCGTLAPSQQQMNLNDLTVNFAHLDRQALVSDWSWLIGKSKLPILLLASGDAFVQDAKAGSVHFLDVGAGTLSQVTPSFEKFKHLLSDRDFVLKYFAVDMIADLRQSGCTLAPGQIYSFKIPPILGGAYALENVEPTDIEVHYSVAGQVHEQVSNLPEGAAISGISIK